MGFLQKLTLNLLLLFSPFFFSPKLLACGQTPRPPMCGKTVVYAQAGPTGNVFTVDQNYDFQVTVFIGATAACSATPTQIDFNLTMVCDRTEFQIQRTVTSNQQSLVVNGFNDITFSLPVQFTTPHLCLISGTASVTFSDGMVISSGAPPAGAETVVCVVDQVNQQPLLEMELIDPLSPIVSVLPGDPAVLLYRITNNHTLDFRGTLTIGTHNTTFQPTMDTPGGNGDGVYAPGDPQGDHPPIFFEDELKQGICPPLPKEPSQVDPPSKNKEVDVPAGGFVDVVLIVRQWPLCSTGTCAQSVTLLDGTFTDTSVGLAWANTVIRADHTTNPNAGCPEQVAPVILGPNQGDPTKGRLGLPLQQLNPELPPLLEVDIELVQLELQGLPAMAPFNVQPLLPNEIRNVLFEFPDGPFSGAQGQTRIQCTSTDGNYEVFRMNSEIMSHAPSGFDTVGPLAMMTFGVDAVPADGNPEAVFELLIQFQATFIDDQEDYAEGQVSQFIFTDGFESGDVSAWSASPPARGNTYIGFMPTFDIRSALLSGVPTFPCPEGLSSDFDGDWLVTMADFTILAEDFNLDGEPPRDRNNDGRVGVIDLLDMLDRIGCQESEEHGTP